MTNIDDLIARLEAAEHGSRELDALLWIAIGDVKMRWSERQQAWAFFNAPFEKGRLACLSNVKGTEAEAIAALGGYSFGPAYTTSLDAITSLIGEKLPGGAVRSHTHDGKKNDAFGEVEERPFPDHRLLVRGRSYAATEPLTRCIAFLRAWKETINV